MAEAAEYAPLAFYDGTVLDLFQCFELSDPPADGAEVFSLIRESELPPDEYLDRFFSTGAELERVDDDA